MSVQILGGQFKGYSVQVPELVSRPTSVLLRRRLFDRYQNLSGFSFIDGLAGSGAVGFEALSRGADSLVFVESNYSAIQLIKKNIQGLIKWGHLENATLPIKTVQEDVIVYLRNWSVQYKQLDLEAQKHAIIFFDPPYEKHDLYEKLRHLFFENKFFHGELWIESEMKKGVPPDFWPKDFPPTKIINQGDSYLAIFHF